MLPLWQAEFGLTYAALGPLRSVLVGAMASLQIPAGLAAERFGAGDHSGARHRARRPRILLAGASTGFAMLLGALFIGGIGSSTQHPIASALVARAFAGPRSLKALGTYNFTGDLGKMTLPATLSLMLLAMAWRPALAILGSVGIAVAVVIFIATPRYEHGVVVHPQSDPRAAPERSGAAMRFRFLVAIGVIDSATRMAFLLFLPFVLRNKGASEQTIGLALTLVFAGGAAGKLACAFIGARIGAIGTVWLTEGSTAVGILALFPLPLDGRSVAAAADRYRAQWHVVGAVRFGARSGPAAHGGRRALSIFYTGTIGSGAIAPILFGRVGDAARRLARFDAGRRVRAVDAAVVRAAARRIGARIRLRDGGGASNLRLRNSECSRRGSLYTLQWLAAARGRNGWHVRALRSCSGDAPGRL